MIQKYEIPYNLSKVTQNHFGWNNVLKVKLAYTRKILGLIFKIALLIHANP